jgi:hypothetical protein
MPPLPRLPEPASGAQYDPHTMHRYDERTLRAWARAYGLACVEACALECEATRIDPVETPEYDQACDDCAAAIRALPVED